MAQANLPKFDFFNLVQTFGKLLPDYFEETNVESPSLSRQFAEKVIFEYGPESKFIKKYGKDHTWKYRVYIGTKKITIYVATTFFDQQLPQQPIVEKNKIKLTFKQASLLAVHKYCQIVPLLVSRNEIILTPLAGAIFHKESLMPILRDLQILQKGPVSISELITAIICSCQTDGFHLPLSVCHIAVVAIVCTVREQKLRESIIKSTIKRFAKQGKRFDDVKFQIYMRYANQQADINRLIENLNLGISPSDGSDIIHTESSTTSIESMESSNSDSCDSEKSNKSEKKNVSKNLNATDKQNTCKKNYHFEGGKDKNKKGNSDFGHVSSHKKSFDSKSNFRNDSGFHKQFNRRDSSQGSSYSVKTEPSSGTTRYRHYGKPTYDSSQSKKFNNFHNSNQSIQSNYSKNNQNQSRRMGEQKPYKRDISQSSTYSERLEGQKSRDGSRYMRQNYNKNQTFRNDSSETPSYAMKSPVHESEKKNERFQKNKKPKDKSNKNTNEQKLKNSSNERLKVEETLIIKNNDKEEDVLDADSDDTELSLKFKYVDGEYIHIEEDNQPTPFLKMLGEMGLIKEQRKT